MPSLVRLVAACAVVASVAVAQSFIVGRAGAQFPDAPGGYVMASLADVQSSQFASSYNAFGLTPASGNGDSISVPHCAFVAVNEGFLAFLAPGNITVLAPFSNGGQWEEGASLANPMWFGAISSGGTGAAKFIGALNAAQQKALRTVSSRNGGGFCNTLAYWAVFTAATFVLGRTGPGYTPPASGLGSNPELATLADVRSRRFVETYNTQGIDAPVLYKSGSPSGCCALQLQDGFVTYASAGTVVPHYRDASGLAACFGTAFASDMSGKQRLGTGPWGADAALFFPTLNVSTLSQLATTPAGPDGCGSGNSYGLFKTSSIGPGPGPGPSPLGDCFEIDLRAGYYTPSGGSCLSDKWRFDTFNASVHQTVQLNDFDTCGYAVDVSNFQIETFNEQYAQVSINGFTNCAGCNDKTVLVPMKTGSSMSTVCHQTVGEFGWCELLVQIDKNYDCPTRSPNVAGQRRP